MSSYPAYRNAKRNRSREINKFTRQMNRYKNKVAHTATGWSDDDQEYERELYRV